MGRIQEESYSSHRDYRSMEVYLYMRNLWDILKDMRIPVVLGTTDAALCYYIVVRFVVLVAAQSWVLSRHTISILLTTLQVMNFPLGTGFGDSVISYWVTSNNPFQGMLQVNRGRPVLWICVITYFIKRLRQRGH